MFSLHYNCERQVGQILVKYVYYGFTTTKNKYCLRRKDPSSEIQCLQI
jgi:hypothetical protein